MKLIVTIIVKPQHIAQRLGVQLDCNFDRSSYWNKALAPNERTLSLNDDLGKGQ
jgi:hypothetical protein